MSRRHRSSSRPHALPLSLGGGSGSARRCLPIPRIPRGPLKAVACVLVLALLGVVGYSTLQHASVPVSLYPSEPDKKAPSPLDLQVNPVRDAYLVHPDISRSFEEPDYALLSNPQPHEIGCDVQLSGSTAGPLVFLGIFSTAGGRARRDLYRKLILPDFPETMVVKFILGKQKPQNILDRDPEEEVKKEMAQHGDMVILDCIDNIDNGKTHEYFKWVAKTYGGDGPKKGRPRFVMKADDDTLLVMPNIISSFRDLDCSKNIYWGTSAGRSGHFGDYFRGLAYAFSWPLVAWIGGADMPLAHTVKIEDARIERIDMGWNMGDWNQLHLTIETVALHWLKLDEWVEEQYKRLRGVWEAAERDYDDTAGVPRWDSMASGKFKPEEAMKEIERQKELGWDVKNNVNDVA